ncbi:MAG: putative DNA-binding protein [Clostridia bacterium]|nr:putative DNA-binding protein [Clostridia bacterium]
MEKNVKISMLNQIYGKLLTKKQYEIIDNYYNQDLSLSEIAENNKITRQAVRDILKKGENKLFEYEKNLMFMEKTVKQEKKIKKVLEELIEIQKNESNQRNIETLENIKKQCKDFIS